MYLLIYILALLKSKHGLQVFLMNCNALHAVELVLGIGKMDTSVICLFHNFTVFADCVLENL